MRIDRVEINGFRSIVKKEIKLRDLTTFMGEMGTGKTSQLLAILYGLTGSTPSYLNLDDLIHIDSEFMWVKLIGEYDGIPFTIERKKRRDKPSTVKISPRLDMKISEKIFIEGREIAKLFVGAPSEKALKMDSLLGLSVYDQTISELSTASIDRRIIDLNQFMESIKQNTNVTIRQSNTNEELAKIKSRLKEVEDLITGDRERFSWAEVMQDKIEQSRTIYGEAKSKKSMIEKYQFQISSTPLYSQVLDDQMSEIDARHKAMERRATFLEAAMQTLNIEGASVEEIKNCPLCGKPISPEILEAFHHYEQEYLDLGSRMSEVSSLLSSTKAKVEKARSDSDRAEFLRNEVSKLELEIAETSKEVIPVEETQKVENILKIKDDLTREKAELEHRKDSLIHELETLETISQQTQQISSESIEKKLKKLTELGNMLKKVKEALTQSLSEARGRQVSNLRATFKATFSKIYPYQRFSDVDFETLPIRGRETLMVKAKVSEGWIYSHQMSTGENVAISFAILFAVNQIEESHILLLDEPEEGLDENGVTGLAEVLNNLRKSTQIVVATRSQQLAQLLSPKNEETLLT